jgi:hypothetical protein
LALLISRFAGFFLTSAGFFGKIINEESLVSEEQLF